MVVSLLCLLSVGAMAADPRLQFANETGLDFDLINVVQVDVGGVELTVVFVFINERTFSSKISPALRETLKPYVGRNAFYVNPSVEGVVSQFAFAPQAVAFAQAGQGTMTPSLEDWVEITPGFLGGRFETNPAGPDKGSGSEGILILGDRLDADLPFELLYGGQRAAFDLGVPTPAGTPEGSGSSAWASQDPVDIAPLAVVSSLQDVLDHYDFSAETMSAFFGVYPTLVRAIRTDSRGEELRLLFVRLEAPIFASALGPEMLAAVEPLVGSGAVMVWAFSPVGAGFSPWHFYVQQGGTNYVFFSSASFVELTPGFLRTTRVEAGEVVAGIIRLPRGVDATNPFTVFYGTAGVSYP